MNILVTGAAGGIGSKIVNVLGRKSEVQVIAQSRSEDALKRLSDEVFRAHGRRIDMLVEDFNNEDFESRIYQHINNKYGELTYVINNAGHLVNKPFEQLSNEELSNQLNTNFTAPFKLIQSLIPLLRKSTDHAHVVNIGSMGGFQGSAKYPGLSAYSASKAALANLTECLAAEYASQRISFNCLALGSANTAMLQKAFPDYTSRMEPGRMAEFIADFTLKGFEFFNGKVLPVAGTET